MTPTTVQNQDIQPPFLLLPWSTMESPKKAADPNALRTLMQVLPPVLKFLELSDIFAKLMPLCKCANHIVSTDNYTLFKKFLQLFCINYQLKHNDGLPSQVCMVQFIKENVRRVREL